MAAIIAQLTLGNRERKAQALHNIGCTKCNYTLKPFHQNGFDPKVHNRYILERERYKKMYLEMGKVTYLSAELVKEVESDNNPTHTSLYTGRCSGAV